MVNFATFFDNFLHSLKKCCIFAPKFRKAAEPMLLNHSMVQCVGPCKI